MSVKGSIETRCPKKCEPFEAEVWSIVHGGTSPDLRSAVLAGECNLLVCSSCETAFFPSESYVYIESEAEILAVVLPESYLDEEEYWRKKMKEDFKKFSDLAEDAADVEPNIFFGPTGLSALLQDEDYRHEESEVMEAFAQRLGLSLYPVSPRAAREKSLPPLLPYDPKEGKDMRAQVVAGLDRLVRENGALTSYRGYLEELRARPQDSLLPGKKK